jgi:hypothetical protein
MFVEKCTTEVLFKMKESGSSKDFCLENADLCEGQDN